MSDHGTRMQIYVTPNTISQCGNHFRKFFYSNRTKKVRKKEIFFKYQVGDLQQTGEISVIC